MLLGMRQYFTFKRPKISRYQAAKYMLNPY